MRFKFSLEKLMSHRRALENQARRDWIEAQTAVNESKARIDRMFRSIEDSRAERFKHETTGVTSELTHFDLFTRGQMQRIEAEKVELRSLTLVADGKLEVLMERAKDRKALEKLKEKRLAEHRESAKRREIRQIDDLVTMRTERKANNGS